MVQVHSQRDVNLYHEELSLKLDQMTYQEKCGQECPY